MHHCGRYFHAGRKAIGQNPANLALQYRNQAYAPAPCLPHPSARWRSAGHRGFSAIARICIDAVASDDQRCRPKNLIMQARCSLMNASALVLEQMPARPCHQRECAASFNRGQPLHARASLCTPLWYAEAIPAVSMVHCFHARQCFARPWRQSGRSSGPLMASTRPGLVQNCPTPMVIDRGKAAGNLRRRALARALPASGRTD